jgi:hypothetical protein
VHQAACGRKQAFGTALINSQGQDRDDTGIRFMADNTANVNRKD